MKNEEICPALKTAEVIHGVDEHLVPASRPIDIIIRLRAENAALHQLLNVADQRNDDLTVPPAGLICDEVTPITEQAWSSLDSQPAGEVEVNHQYLCKGLYERWMPLQESEVEDAKREGFQVRELVDRAHVTRLTAENARLQAEVNELTQQHMDLVSRNRLLRARKDLPVDRLPSHTEMMRLQAERDALKAEVERLNELLAKEGRHFDAVWQKGLDLQSELTKARELIRTNATDFEGIRRALAAFHKENQKQWCGYLDDSLGICLFRLKELAAFLDHQSAPAVCPKCGDTGEADSGGVTPWGERISIPCDCQSAPAAKGESS